MNDEYEAHALFALAFDCEECGKTLGFPENEAQFSNAWYRWLANTAKDKKWLVPPADAEGADGCDDNLVP